MSPLPPIAEPPIPFFPAGLVRIIGSTVPGFVLRLMD
jgi:hypothetical protein